MKILVFGNLGSGKSTVSLFLNKKLSGFSQLSIDNYRRLYGDGTMDAERLAKRLFIEAVRFNANQIVEATGCGETAVMLSQKLLESEERKVIILITTPLDVCLKRLEARVWNVPYPAPPEMAFSLARETEERIKAGEPIDHWKHHSNIEIITHQCINQSHLQSIWSKLQKSLNP